MSWLERLRDTAREVARQTSASADRLAEHLARNVDGVVGSTAGELLAEKRWRQAQTLAESGLDEAGARSVVALLEPVAKVDSHYAAPIAFLLGQAHEQLESFDDASREYAEAAYLLRDARWAQTASPTLVERLGQVPDELLAEVLCGLANVALRQDRPADCRRYCDEAIEADRRRLTPYYLRGLAMLRLQEPDDEIVQVWLRAARVGGPSGRATVRGWVGQHLPAHADWFEKLAV